MERVSKKEKETDETIATCYLLWKVFTDERYTKAFCRDVTHVGEMFNSLLLTLQGKDNDGTSK